MKLRTMIAGSFALMLAAALSAHAAETTKLYARSGSKLRIEGTSNIHDWQVQSPLIGGFIEVGPNFPTEPGQSLTPGKVDASGQVFIIVRSLMSIEKDGSPYSSAMDNVMYEHLKVTEAPANGRIVYHLKGLVLKETPKDKNSPYVFEATGDLVVAGVTNQISMPINVLPLGNAVHEVKISGETQLKMTDFKVEPPAPKIAFGMIKTGDAVKIIFDWMVAPRAKRS